MSELLTLYHGSPRIIQTPTFGEGKANNDYGLGFYCTESESLAMEWACTSAADGFSNRYSLDPSNMRVLHLNSMEYSVLNWMAVLVNHRLFRIRNPIAGKAQKYLTEYFDVNVNAFDLVIGYRADDSYFDFAEAFLNNAITVEQLSTAMRLGKLGEQIVLKSRYAFECIHFETAVPADRLIWYPKRKARSEAAAASWQMISSSQEEDGLYMADIIRGKVTNDDPRIPRNLPIQKHAGSGGNV